MTFEISMGVRVMMWARRLWLRLQALFHRHRFPRQLDDEIQFHLEQQIAENIAAGISPEEARYAAMRAFGNPTLLKEETRDTWGWVWLEQLAGDVRYAARTLRKSPGFTAVAVLTLALGIGANTSIFSLVNGILLVPLPFPSPERLVSITGTYPKGGIVAMREQVRAMDVAAYYEGHEFNLTGLGQPVRLTGTLVSAEFFAVLGARPELGRTLLPGEDIPGQDNYVILSHTLWQQRFGGNPTIVGRSIQLQGINRQVVGVMPENFRFPSAKTQVWIPLHNDPRNVIQYWADDFMPALGRLRQGFTFKQAQTEIRMFQSRVSAMFPWPMPSDWNADASVVPLRNGMVADVRLRLLMLLGAVTLIVLIACVNVANLTLAHSATREKEIAVRTALGAGRKRIVVQLLTESVLLAGLGALLGLPLAPRGLSTLQTLRPT